MDASITAAPYSGRYAGRLCCWALVGRSGTRLGERSAVRPAGLRLPPGGLSPCVCRGLDRLLNHRLQERGHADDYRRRPKPVECPTRLDADAMVPVVRG